MRVSRSEGCGTPSPGRARAALTDLLLPVCRRAHRVRLFPMSMRQRQGGRRRAWAAGMGGFPSIPQLPCWTCRGEGCKSYRGRCASCSASPRQTCSHKSPLYTAFVGFSKTLNLYSKYTRALTFENLWQLSLADNALSSLPAWFPHLSSLRQLSLRCNQFSELPQVPLPCTHTQTRLQRRNVAPCVCVRACVRPAAAAFSRASLSLPPSLPLPRAVFNALMHASAEIWRKMAMSW